ERGIVAEISGTTIWRWLPEDAIKPWQHRSWIFPRDPNFETKAARVLDLYAREWEGKPLGDDDFVISSDQKTSSQARVRRHETLAPARGRTTRLEFEYARGGALQYLAAWDVHRAKIFGRCEPKTGIVPFDRLVDQVMTTEPYASARRAYWLVDNGSSHRGQAACDGGRTFRVEVHPRGPLRPHEEACRQTGQPARSLSEASRGSWEYVIEIVIRSTKLEQVRAELMRRRHLPIPEQGRWLASVVRGHANYYAVPGNLDAVAQFRTQV
ncbi:MAG: transposase, partial [Acidimicrobiales bacterium]